MTKIALRPTLVGVTVKDMTRLETLTLLRSTASGAPLVLAYRELCLMGSSVVPRYRMVP